MALGRIAFGRLATIVPQGHLRTWKTKREEKKIQKKMQKMGDENEGNLAGWREMGGAKEKWEEMGNGGKTEENGK